MKTQIKATITEQLVHFDIPSYLGGGSGVASIPATTFTEAVLKLQEACPRLMVNRQMISSKDATAAGHRVAPRAEDRPE